MKSITDKINENLTSDKMLFVVQNEISGGAGYVTMDIEKAKSNYKHGYICNLIDQDAISLVAFNKLSDYAQLFDQDESEYEDIKNLSLGESCKIEDCYWMKIW